MKRTLLTICTLLTAAAVAAQEPVVVEPKSQRQTTTTTTPRYTSSSSSYVYSYRDRANRWALGFNLDAATHNPVWAVGLGANLQFFATDAFRIEASYNGHIRRNFWASWDVNINIHYLIEVADHLELYPLLGVAFNHAQFKVEKEDSKDGLEYSRKYGKVGLNLGGGIQYSFNDHLFVKAEAYWKYMPERTLPIEMQLAADTERHFGQRAVIIAGVGYCF